MAHFQAVWRAFSSPFVPVPCCQHSGQAATAAASKQQRSPIHTSSRTLKGHFLHVILDPYQLALWGPEDQKNNTGTSMHGANFPHSIIFVFLFLALSTTSQFWFRRISKMNSEFEICTICCISFPHVLQLHPCVLMQMLLWSGLWMRWGSFCAVCFTGAHVHSCILVKGPWSNPDVQSYSECFCAMFGHAHSGKIDGEKICRNGKLGEIVHAQCEGVMENLLVDCTPYYLRAVQAGQQWKTRSSATAKLGSM